MVKSKFIGALLVGVSAVSLSACSGLNMHNNRIENKPAPLVQAEKPNPQVIALKQCVAAGSYMMAKGGTVRVSADNLKDDTGKANYSDSGNGKLLPDGQASKTLNILTSLTGDGGKPLFKVPNFTYTRMMAMTRDLGGPYAAGLMQRAFATNLPQYIITGQSGSAADSTSSGGITLRIMGIGPDMRYGGAQIEANMILAQSDFANNNIDVLSTAHMSSQVVFDQKALGVAHNFGETLTTGEIGERTQHLTQKAAGELVEAATMKLVFDMPEFVVDSHCRQMLADVEAGKEVSFDKKNLTGRMTQKTLQKRLAVVQVRQVPKPKQSQRLN